MVGFKSCVQPDAWSDGWRVFSFVLTQALDESTTASRKSSSSGGDGERIAIHHLQQPSLTAVAASLCCESTFEVQKVAISISRQCPLSQAIVNGCPWPTTEMSAMLAVVVVVLFADSILGSVRCFARHCHYRHRRRRCRRCCTYLD